MFSNWKSLKRRAFPTLSKINPFVTATSKFLSANAFKFDMLNPLPDCKILDWSKLKQIADDILKCIENEK